MRQSKFVQREMADLHKQLHILLPVGGSDGYVASIWNKVCGGHFAQALVLNLHAAAKHVFNVSFKL